MVYIQLLEGETRAKARPVFATSDPRVIADLADSLMRRMIPALMPSTAAQKAWDADALACAEPEGERR